MKLLLLIVSVLIPLLASGWSNSHLPLRSVANSYKDYRSYNRCESYDGIITNRHRRNSCNSNSKLCVATVDSQPIETTVTKIDSKDFLKTMLSSRTTADMKERSVQMLRKLRESRNSVERQMYDSLFDDCLTEIDKIEHNRIANLKILSGMPSYRVKVAALRRVMEKLIDDDIKVDFPNQSSEFLRKRALSVIMSQLRTHKSIRTLEKEANRNGKSIKRDELIARTPAGLETPKYEVVYPQKTWEVRKYQNFAVCTYEMKDEASGPKAFNSLAGYIFGGNAESEKMAMTTPVISNKAKKMSFVMPSKYWDASKSEASTHSNTTLKAPAPLEGSEVKVESVTADGNILSQSDLLAVLWFGGFASEIKVKSCIEDLVAAIQADDKWEIEKVIKYNNYDLSLITVINSSRVRTLPV